MGSSEEAVLDRVEAQRSVVVSHGQWKRSYFSMNLIKRGLRSLGLLQTGEAETEPVPDYLTNLEISDVFNLPGESMQIDPEIFTAVCAGNKNSLEELKRSGKPMACLKSDQVGSVLHLAAACNHLELVKIIASECPCLLLKLDSRNQLPLHVAAHAGYSTVVEALVETVGYISAGLSDEDGRERLNLYVVKNKDGDTPLHLALKGRHMSSANYLVSANQQTSFFANKDGISPLYLAVETGDLLLVKAMLETRKGDELGRRYADIDSLFEDEHGRRYILDIDSHLEGRKYLLHAALKAKSLDTLEFLLKEYPSLVNMQDEEGRTCLWLAASMGYYEGVSILLDRWTKGVYVCNGDGSFPIHIAVEKRHMRVVFLLLKRYPDSKHLLNKQGQNIVHIATKSGIGALFLFSYLWLTGWINTLVETQDKDGNSPLHEATIHWRPRTLFVLLLMTKIKWLYVQNNDGLTALDIAEKNMKRNYIFMERVTLMVLLYFYAPISRKSWWIKVTKPSEPLEGGKTNNYVDTLLVVAALVATVTFTAGFTIPGGFNGSGEKLGMAALENKPKLAYFMIFNIMAMQSSIVTIAILIWGQLGDQSLVPMAFTWALRSLFFALLCMVLAFYWGVMVTFVHVKGVVIFLNVTYAIFLFLMLFNLGPHVFLQTPGIPAFLGSCFLMFVMLVNEDSFPTPVKMIFGKEDAPVKMISGKEDTPVKT
ncbi:PREDICTED: alpha-latroinsectotoxin-Lt1a-like [Brassica oleracea var. oleracea]|uniref:PGG domain-containing protein n=1 Tax=Brassica oleracea var. oleracea TaxID=109376 RepID=A0A0D3BKY8_BRAOL|nr:PREDICTED: alpha-latroinsectotoxin-Lt1a-like [Brassica oleracea var. oleracea]